MDKAGERDNFMSYNKKKIEFSLIIYKMINKNINGLNILLLLLF